MKKDKRRKKKESISVSLEIFGVMCLRKSLKEVYGA
jgi:hypothetical protein